MPKQRITPDDFVRQVADTFKASKPPPRRLTQQSGDAGTQGGQKFVNPMDAIGQMVAGGESGALEQVPAGTEGQVLTMTDVGAGVLKPRMADATAAAGGQYRQYVLVSDGAGGFDFVDDGAGNPVATLEDLE